MAIQQTLTVGGTVTVDDKLTLTIFDAGLVGGKEAVVYKPNTGDTIADIVLRLRNKINNSTTLAALDITAKVSSTDSSVLLIESPTFDATEKFTSYSAVVKAGGSETMTLGKFWGTNGAQSVTVGGTVTVGDVVSFAVYNLDLPDSQKTVSYTVQAGDNLNQIACGLRTSLNNDLELAGIGTHARCGAAAGGPGMLEVTSQSANPLVVWKSFTTCKPVDTMSIAWPPNSRVKFCGTASLGNGQIVRATLEALGNSSAFPGGANIVDSSQKLSGNLTRTWFVFGNHDEYYYSQHIPFFHETGGPAIAELQVIHDPVDPNTGAIPLILGYTYGFGDSTYSVIFESSKDDKHFVGAGIPNNYIAHSTAHETGHHIDEWSGAKLSDSAEFQTAWDRDIAAISAMPACKRLASDQRAVDENQNPTGGYYTNGSDQQMGGDGVGGLFSSAKDYKGDFICNGTEGDGYALNGAYGGLSNLEVISAAFPRFSAQGGAC